MKAIYGLFWRVSDYIFLTHSLPIFEYTSIDQHTCYIQYRLQCYVDQHTSKVLDVKYQGLAIHWQKHRLMFHLMTKTSAGND